MRALASDLRQGIRQLVTQPGFALGAVVTLALGIGANTAIFSVIHAVMLRPPPYPEPDRLAVIEVQAIEPGDEVASLAWSYPLYENFQEQTSAFESVAAFTAWNPTLTLTGVEIPRRLRVEFVSAEYFRVLGVQAEEGRAFRADEDHAPRAAPVALLTHELWRGAFGEDPGIVGDRIQLNGHPLTVVGVLPRGFEGLSGNAEVFLPMAMAPAFLGERRLEMRFAFWHGAVGRLRPGASWESARAELELAASALGEGFELPGGARLDLDAVRLSEWRVDPEIRTPLYVLLAAVTFVLLIACVNIANLVMSRAMRRRRDLAIRAALGADRAGLMRLLLSESLVLAALGGGLGLLVAMWGIDLLAAVKPAGLTAVDFAEVRLDGAVLAFNLAVSAGAGILFGSIPALQLYRGGLFDALRQGGARSASGITDLRRPSARSALVVGEIALATLLLIGAGLALRSFSEMRGTELGFRPDDLLSARVSLPRQEYDEAGAVRFLADLRARFTGAPGVSSAALAYCLPLSGDCDRATMSRQGEEVASESTMDVVVNLVDETFFRTMAIPVLRGRGFEPGDDADAPRVAVVNLAAAQAYWTGEDPIGDRIRLSLGWPEGEYAEVVGVVGDVRYGDLEEGSEPTVYLPFRQFTYHSNFFLARSETAAPGALTERLRAAVMALDPSLPVHDVRAMESRVADATSQARFSASLLASFAALALILAAVGVYAVMAFAVSGRTREIGLRMAVGARSGEVLRLVLRDSLALTALGLAIGIVAALALTRLATGQLYGVTPTDPWTFAAVIITLSLTALGASYLPAWRAARVDPLVALREE